MESVLKKTDPNLACVNYQSWISLAIKVNCFLFLSPTVASTIHLTTFYMLQKTSKYMQTMLLSYISYIFQVICLNAMCTRFKYLMLLSVPRLVIKTTEVLCMHLQ
jgi:hypothetical protein